MQQNALFNRRKYKRSFNLLFKFKYTLFYLYTLFLKLIGLAPWEVDVCKIFNSSRFFHNQLFYPHEPSKSGVLYNILLIIIMFVYSTTILVLKLLDQNHVESAMVKIIDKILLMSGIFIVLFVWLIYVLQKKTIVTILNRLYDVNYSLKKCRKYTLESDSFVYITGFCNFALCFSIAILEIIVDSKYTAIMWAIPFIVGTSVFAQYTIFLNIIVQFFKSINKTILKIGNLSSKNEIKVSFVTKILYEDSLIKDIYNINFDFINLCEISNQIADFYAIPILVLTIYFVPTTTYNLYFMILSFIVSDDKSTIALYFDCGILIFCIFLSYAALTTNVTRITREVKYLYNLFHHHFGK